MSVGSNGQMLAATLPGVEAELNYLKAGQGRPVSYTFEPPPGTPWVTGELEPRRVTIRDGRPMVALNELSLERSGFTQLAHRSVVADFSHDATIRDIYYREAEALLRDVTGAEKIVVFDHTLRDSAQGARGTPDLREPVRRVHNDQTPASAVRRVRDHLPAEEAEARLKHRFAVVNLWRPLATVERLPLALCDARTISPNDLVYPDKVGETCSFTWNPNHRWYWFPRLRPDEVLLLKIFDSREDVARFTAHTAFEDPNGAREAPARRSIELRALVFWPQGK
ncbi:CmcJ/NvfI family oxidoreductase [Variovorax sp. RB3P1]|uniref:CmcJ/NvfI family oxidoreductase n=1 Tax=Variovorax sp. RB3P1 TaxID=3443732 RepID=UPI003F445E95